MDEPWKDRDHQQKSSFFHLLIMFHVRLTFPFSENCVYQIQSFHVVARDAPQVDYFLIPFEQSNEFLRS